MENKRSRPAGQQNGFWEKERGPGLRLLLTRRPALAVRVDLLAHHGEQAAVALARFLNAFQLLQADTNELREVFNGIRTFRRGGHGRNCKEMTGNIATGYGRYVAPPNLG